eukprot:gene3122-5292_t
MELDQQNFLLNQDETFEVFLFLNVEEILYIGVTCKLFNQVSKKNILWKQIMKKYITPKPLKFHKEPYKVDWKIECLARKRFGTCLKNKEEKLYSKFSFKDQFSRVIPLKHFYFDSMSLFNLFKDGDDYFFIEINNSFYLLIGDYKYSKKIISSFKTMGLIRNDFIPQNPVNIKYLFHAKIIDNIKKRLLSDYSMKNLMEMLYLIKFDQYFVVCSDVKKMEQLNLIPNDFGNLKEEHNHLEIQLFGFCNKFQSKKKTSIFYSVLLTVDEKDFDLKREFVSTIEETFKFKY